MTEKKKGRPFSPEAIRFEDKGYPASEYQEYKKAVRYLLNINTERDVKKFLAYVNGGGKDFAVLRDMALLINQRLGVTTDVVRQKKAARLASMNEAVDPKFVSKLDNLIYEIQTMGGQDENFGVSNRMFKRNIPTSDPEEKRAKKARQAFRIYQNKVYGADGEKVLAVFDTPALAEEYVKFKRRQFIEWVEDEDAELY